jgi:hypothetical protein
MQPTSLPGARKRNEFVTNLNNLPLSDQEALTKIAGRCLSLKDRLESNGFKVGRFRVVVSADALDLRHTIEYIHGIPTEIVVDGTLPANTIEAAALVR